MDLLQALITNITFKFNNFKVTIINMYYYIDLKVIFPDTLCTFYWTFNIVSS